MNVDDIDTCCQFPTFRRQYCVCQDFGPLGAFAKLLDTEYFGDASSDSSDSEPSNPPSNPPWPSHASSSEGDSDGTGPSGSGSGLLSHASQTTTDSDVSSLTSVDSGLPSGVEQDSASASDTEIVWAKNACGVWGLANIFANGKLYFTCDVPANCHRDRSPCQTCCPACP